MVIGSPNGTYGLSGYDLGLQRGTQRCYVKFPASEDFRI
jgi:hypothetical protein